LHFSKLLTLFKAAKTYPQQWANLRMSSLELKRSLRFIEGTGP
jgi:hypothetical protein